ncbi:RHS repeat-associated core domain-containing protein [Nitrosomonas sp.]|uniref:RHS repeat-associated core domain-containing protein n=1 Tax=Nitrosomonas sp. TaxID=42353 RepID=UPI00208CD1CF|nr:RHS repeat-associated core domain-containing protein [Nitrosomonas sp.]GJL76748.1 MAG: hypothetical protein NMNS02_28540 [Nitrosomonas sp.]
MKNTHIQEFLRYRGDKILLIETVPERFGDGALVNVDADGDGIFEYQVSADEKGLYTLQFDAPALTPARGNLLTGSFDMYVQSVDGLQKGETVTVNTLQISAENPAAVVPLDRVTAEWFASTEALPVLEKPVPGICGCVTCAANDALAGSSSAVFSSSYTPSENGVELATGKLRQHIPITAFDTRQLGFDLLLHHTSLTDYNGAWGQGVSHSFGMMIVQTGDVTAQMITSDLRCYDIFTEDGSEWFLPAEFFSTLTLDSACHRWTLTHFSGTQMQFYQAALNCPGYLLSICDPNGNATNLCYDASGMLQWIKTDLDQMQRFSYGLDGILDSYTDHIGRQWNFEHDAQGRLTQIKQPATEYADIKAGQEIAEKDLPGILVMKPRVWTFGYANDVHPGHITSIMDPRGATPESFNYDEMGRVITVNINGKGVSYQYQPVTDPAPLEKLETSNVITRVIDREGNIADYEIHGPAGGPIIDRGAFGLRRTVTFTETGKNNAPLRDDEPDYWEQRWLHDCDCLTPLVVVQPFSSKDSAGLDFDENGIPGNWPRDVYTFNRNRQVISHTYTDGTEAITTQSTYQTFSFGQNGQFSRLLSQTDPRAFDDNAIYSGLNFESTYQYDDRGNRIAHSAPIVARGIDTPQIISETWTYNSAGQVLNHTDPNGNITTYVYYAGSSTGGDINSKGESGGYLKSTTRGADGSADPATNLTNTYKVNSLGLITQKIDPKGFVYDTAYNDLQEVVVETDPPVTLRNGQQVRYQTLLIYDGAGNQVLRRRSNIDLDGSVPANDFIDTAMSFDAVNNLLSERVEVDENDANDLVTRYDYDGNDDLSVTQKPEGNRTFNIYDERRLLFKTFYGVAPGLQLLPISPVLIPGSIKPVSDISKLSVTGPLQPFPLIDKRRISLDVFMKKQINPFISFGYPLDKRAESLVRTAFVGLSINDYDARLNRVRMRDGRGNFDDHFFDFYNREIAYADANGNGWLREFDDASNVLTESRGAVSKTTGQITELLARSYSRYDEIGRQYQQVNDIDLSTDESRLLNPGDDKNSSYLTAFDAGSRVTMQFDANGNPSSMDYDAANRTLTITDALGNQQRNSYDANSNVVGITEIEVPGPGAAGVQERYVTTSIYDALNRRTEQHIRGLNGNSIDHAWFFAYDSRHNQRLVQDAENNYSLTGFDDQNRQIVMQRFDGDPLTGKPNVLLHYEWVYDKNSNTTEERALSDVNDANSTQVTRHAFDNLDRAIRTVYPDSDDPVDGSGDGPDGIFDRIEMRYDENSNLVQMTDQRGVVFKTSFDPGNRQTEQNITLPDDVPGTTRQVFSYDALNRTTTAGNNYASVDQQFDAFSRLTTETQRIRLDGSGFSNGWEQPVQVTHRYDKQSNRIACQVLEGNNTDLNIATGFDALNRTSSIAAGYFNIASHIIANYAYAGPGRVQQKTLGNGAALNCTYDAKRRLKTHQWNGPGRMLVGFEYDYDRMDNARFERFTHDMGLCDHFEYNNRYEVTGVSYRVPGPVPPAAPVNLFDFDDVFNRRQAGFGGPFDRTAITNDSYAINKANEYTQLTRNGTAITPLHDRAGNSIRFPVRPVTSDPNQQDVIADARWDACNLLFDINPGDVNPQQHYRYDPLRRRIATLELDDAEIVEGSRRYIYDGWSVVEERLFDPGVTLDAASSTLERIYVNGAQIDEPLLTAIDRNQDGDLGGSNDKNVRDVSADQEYYFLNNRLGSVMALLDADKADRVLEYYRYSIYGEPSVLPVVDDDGDGLEDTPLDLSDNFSVGSQFASVEFGNVYQFTARRFDMETGLHYFRARYYDRKQGRFISRDPLGYIDGANLYAGYFVIWMKTDPTGKSPCVGAALIGFGISCGYSCFVGWFRGDSWGDLAQDCFCSGLQGALTTFLSCQFPGVGSGCLAGAAGTLAGSLCNALVSLVRGTKSPSFPAEAFKGGIAAALGCLGGISDKKEVRERLTEQISAFAATAWGKVIDA